MSAYILRINVHEVTNEGDFVTLHDLVDGCQVTFRISAVIAADWPTDTAENPLRIFTPDLVIEALNDEGESRMTTEKAMAIIYGRAA